jgi:hypothetical protein
MTSPAAYRRQQNGWGHPGWESYPGPFQAPQEPLYDPDAALVTVPEPGIYRVKWDVGTSRFILEPVELAF